jgi:hypothetical protein
VARHIHTVVAEPGRSRWEPGLLAGRCGYKHGMVLTCRVPWQQAVARAACLKAAGVIDSDSIEAQHSPLTGGSEQ